MTALLDRLSPAERASVRGKIIADVARRRQALVQVVWAWACLTLIGIGMLAAGALDGGDNDVILGWFVVLTAVLTVVAVARGWRQDAPLGLAGFGFSAAEKQTILAALAADDAVQAEATARVKAELADTVKDNLKQNLGIDVRR